MSLFTVLMQLMKPWGSLYEYVFFVDKVVIAWESWETSVKDLHAVCVNNNNESKNVYGMFQIGF